MYEAFLAMAIMFAQSSPEYVGPAYTSSDGKKRSISIEITRLAMTGCVKAGMGPKTFGRIFGDPTICSRNNQGPYEWDYFGLGIIIHFPARMFGDVKEFQRLNGVIGP